MRWPLISYPQELAHGASGNALGPFIRIRKDQEEDEGVYQHQLRHVKQWFYAGATLYALIGAVARLGGLDEAPEAIQDAVWTIAAFVALTGHEILYTCSKAYRTWSETDAYRKQMQHPIRTGTYLSLEETAIRLAAPRYRLGITVEQAREHLR